MGFPSCSNNPAINWANWLLESSVWACLESSLVFCSISLLLPSLSYSGVTTVSLANDAYFL